MLKHIFHAFKQQTGQMTSQ